MSLNLKTLKHQREFPSLCSMKECMPLFFPTCLFKVPGDEGGEMKIITNESKNNPFLWPKVKWEGKKAHSGFHHAPSPGLLRFLIPSWLFPSLNLPPNSIYHGLWLKFYSTLEPLQASISFKASLIAPKPTLSSFSWLARVSHSIRAPLCVSLIVSGLHS